MGRTFYYLYIYDNITYYQHNTNSLGLKKQQKGKHRVPDDSWKNMTRSLGS